MKTRNLIVLALLSGLVSCATASVGRDLTIIHFNDTHSHLEPERSGEYSGRGGAIERVSTVSPPWTSFWMAETATMSPAMLSK